MNKPIVRKTFRKIIPVLLTCLAIVGLTACTGYSDYDEYHENGVRFALNSKGGKHALVMEYEWDGSMDKESMTINVPDEVSDGYEVIDFGGFTGIGVPALFEIKCYDDYHSYRYGTSDFLAFEGTDPSLYDYPVSFEKIEFTVNLGKNIKKVRLQYDPDPEPVKVTNEDGTVEYTPVEPQNQWLAFKQEDGRVIWYEATLYFNVSPENKYYYSENGKLKKRE